MLVVWQRHHTTMCVCVRLRVYEWMPFASQTEKCICEFLSLLFFFRNRWSPCHYDIATELNTTFTSMRILGLVPKQRDVLWAKQTLSIWALCCSAQSVWRLWHTWSLALSKCCHVCHQCCDNGREKLTTPLNPQGQRNHSQSIIPLILHASNETLNIRASDFFEEEEELNCMKYFEKNNYLGNIYY